MKILFLTDNFPPEINAPATRTYEHVKVWKEKGEDVTVVTCFPNYPQGKVYSGYKNKFPYSNEVYDGIKVVRVWSYMTANEGSFKRILDQTSYAIMAFFVCLFKRTDLIVATSPQFFTVMAAYALSIFKRKKWVFELRDLIPDTIRSVSAIGNSRTLDFLEKIELFLYRKADLIVPVTDAFKENLIKRGIPADKIKVITNGVNLEKFQWKPRNENLVNKYNLKDKFVIGYIGTHGMTQKLQDLIKCFDKINDPEIMFVFLGEGAFKDEMKQIALEKKLSNVLFLDQVSKKEIVDYWSIMDVSLVHLRKSPTFKTVIPSKIFEAAAMKKPILLGVEGHSLDILNKYNAGLGFEPENGADLVEKIGLLKNDSQLYNKLANNSYKLALDYERRRLAEKMLIELNRII